MSIISKKFSNKIDAIKSEFEVNKDVDHQGIKGGLNENEISSLIKDVIPTRYKITKGIIENAIGDQSNETDIFIYDDEVLPPYMKKDLTFVPVEAVKYNFEIKSLLNATELKTTIDKFRKFHSIGGYSPTVLFAYSTDAKGSELSRYKKYDNAFFTNPAVSVLCISNKCYYFKNVTEHYLKDICSNTDLMKSFGKSTGLDLEDATNIMKDVLSNDLALSQMSRSQFALAIQSKIQMTNHMNNLDEKDVTLNGVKYGDIKFKIHQWIGVESESNDIELSFLSGISNTLSKGNFGQYLLNGRELDIKIHSICYEDMWGNISCQDFAEEGLNYNPGNVGFSLESSEGTHKLEFEIKK